MVDRLAALPQGKHHAIALELLEHGAELALEMGRAELREAVQARGDLRSQGGADLVIKFRAQVRRRKRGSVVITLDH